MNLPNKITITRMALIPIIIALFLIDSIPYGKFFATIIFIIATVTDFLDGYIARKYNLVTDMGKFLDPVADKVLFMAGFLLIFLNPFIPVEYLILAGIIVVTRDNLVNSLRQIGASKGFVIAAAWSGKIKTTFLDIAIIVIMFYSSLLQAGWGSELFINIVWWIGVVLLAISVILVIYSSIDYIMINKKVFSKNKTEEK